MPELQKEESIIFAGDRDLGAAAPFEEPYRGCTEINGVSVHYIGTLSIATLKNWIMAVRLSLKSDVVYLNSIFSFSFSMFILFALRLCRYEGQIFISPRGELATSALVLGRSGAKAAWLHFLSLFKVIGNKGGQINPVWLASSSKEKKEIQMVFPAALIEVFPEKLRKVDPGFERLIVDSAKLKIAVVGRIAKVKGIDRFLRGLAHVKHPVEVKVIGFVEDQNHHKYLMQLCEHLPKGVSVEWVGPLPQDLLIPELQSSQLLVSLTRGENFGHAIGESLQLGIPVFISDQTPWSIHVNEFSAGVVLSDEDCEDAYLVGKEIDRIATLSSKSREELSLNTKLVLNKIEVSREITEIFRKYV